MVLGAYLLGTFPSALLVGRRSGFDPTAAGSQNPGATNAYRLGGRRAGVAVLALDVAKGAVAAGAGWALGGHGLGVACGAASVVGHCLPVTRRFQGGKGVATFIGVVFGIHWVLGVATALTWLIIAFFFRYSSLASLVSAVFAPVYYLLGNRLQWYAERPVAVALFAMALLLAWRHRANIRRLLEGKEARLGAKKPT